MPQNQKKPPQPKVLCHNISSYRLWHMCCSACCNFFFAKNIFILLSLPYLISLFFITFQPFFLTYHPFPPLSTKNSLPKHLKTQLILTFWGWFHHFHASPTLSHDLPPLLHSFRQSQSLGASPLNSNLCVHFIKVFGCLIALLGEICIEFDLVLWGHYGFESLHSNASILLSLKVFGPWIVLII